MRHVTIPLCPNCGAVERVVLHWNDTQQSTDQGGEWYCFNCESSGVVDLHFHINYIGHKNAETTGNAPMMPPSASRTGYGLTEMAPEPDAGVWTPPPPHTR